MVFISNNSIADDDSHVNNAIHPIVQNLHNGSVISEYTILNKGEELHAIVGKGNDRQFITRVTSTINNNTIIQFWSTDGKRIFTSLEGKNYCIDDAYSILDALFIFESIFTGKSEIRRFENYLFLEGKGICSGFWNTNKSTKVIEVIKANRNTKIEKTENGEIIFSNNQIGSLVIDSEDGSIIEQTHEGRKLIRTRHELIKTHEEINHIVSNIKVDTFDRIPISKVFPWITVVAFDLCQKVIDDIDHDAKIYKEIKENIERHDNRLLNDVIPIIIRDKNHIFSDEKVDILRDLFFEKIEGILKSRTENLGDIESAMKSEKAFQTVIASMHDYFNDMNKKASQESIDSVLRDILGGTLQAKTEQGKKAKKDITDALLRNYCIHVVNASVQRKKRNQDLD